MGSGASGITDIATGALGGIAGNIAKPLIQTISKPITQILKPIEQEVLKPITQTVGKVLEPLRPITEPILSIAKPVIGQLANSIPNMGGSGKAGKGEHGVFDVFNDAIGDVISSVPGGDKLKPEANQLLKKGISAGLGAADAYFKTGGLLSEMGNTMIPEDGERRQEPGYIPPQPSRSELKHQNYHNEENDSGQRVIRQNFGSIAAESLKNWHQPQTDSYIQQQISRHINPSSHHEFEIPYEYDNTYKSPTEQLNFGRSKITEPHIVLRKGPFTEQESLKYSHHNPMKNTKSLINSTFEDFLKGETNDEYNASTHQNIGNQHKNYKEKMKDIRDEYDKYEIMKANAISENDNADPSWKRGFN